MIFFLTCNVKILGKLGIILQWTLIYQSTSFYHWYFSNTVHPWTMWGLGTLTTPSNPPYHPTLCSWKWAYKLLTSSNITNSLLLTRNLTINSRLTCFVCYMYYIQYSYNKAREKNNKKKYIYSFYWGKNCIKVEPRSANPCCSRVSCIYPSFHFWLIYYFSPQP